MKIFGFEIQEAANVMTVFQPLVLFLVWLFTHNSFKKFWRKWKGWIVAVSTIVCVFGLWKQGWLAWLAVPVTVPVWGVIIAAIPVILSVALIAAKLVASLPKTPTFEDYKSDLIFGIQWQWEYHLGQIEPSLMHAFCPGRTCRCRLTHKWNFHGNKTEFSCPNCGFKHTLDNDDYEIRRRVAVEVERRVNTGEFQKALG